MATVTITIPDDLSAQLEPYRESLAAVPPDWLARSQKSAGPYTVYARPPLAVESRPSSRCLAAGNDAVRRGPRSTGTR